MLSWVDDADDAASGSGLKIVVLKHMFGPEDVAGATRWWSQPFPLPPLQNQGVAYGC